MKFISDHFEPITYSCAFAVLSFFGSHHLPREYSDRWGMGSIIGAALIGAYVGYLVRCFRLGKKDAESTIQDE